jgi:alpha-1,6-mannosyltransferase
MAPGVQGPDHLDCGGLVLPATGGFRVVTRRRQPAALIEQARPDIIEAADPYLLGWSVLDAASRLRVPAVAFCHSNLPAMAARLADGAQSWRGRWAARWTSRYLVRLYQGYDLVLATRRPSAPACWRPWPAAHGWSPALPQGWLNWLVTPA